MCCSCDCFPWLVPITSSRAGSRDWLPWLVPLMVPLMVPLTGSPFWFPWLVPPTGFLKLFQTLYWEQRFVLMLGPNINIFISSSFRLHFTSFHIHTFFLVIFQFFFVLCHYCCSRVQVLTTTLLQEFYISLAILNETCFFHETRWSLFRSKLCLPKRVFV